MDMSNKEDIFENFSSIEEKCNKGLKKMMNDE
jgi:hypothetical protein